MKRVHREDVTTKGDQTRQALIDVAVQRFGADGFQSTSVAHIARDAGLARSAPYAYFESKEDLFHHALDHDAAGAIGECLPALLDERSPEAWQWSLITSLVATLERHPLAKRILAGLEPSVTGRVIDLPALVELRTAVAHRLSLDQRGGLIRGDIDVDVFARGLTTVVLSLLMSVVQLGPDTFDAAYIHDVAAVVRASIEPRT